MPGIRGHVAIVLGLAAIALFGFIIEGFATIVPVVTTKKGAEGLEVENGMHVLLAENAEEFVAAVKRIWTEERLAERLAANGLELVTRAYSWDASSRRIMEAVAALDPGE